MSRRKNKNKQKKAQSPQSPQSSSEKDPRESPSRRPDGERKYSPHPDRSHQRERNVVPKNRDSSGSGGSGSGHNTTEREDGPVVYTLPSSTYRDLPPEPRDVNFLPTEAAVQRKRRRLPSYCQLILMPMFATMSKITDNLFLTSIGGMTQENFEKYQIRCVINATVEAPNLRKKGIETIRVPVDDSPNDDIEEFFDLVADKINERTLLNINICVHCVAGVSRSTSLVLAYLMKYQKMDLHSAFSFTHAKRPVVRPNNGFFHQLLNYEYKLFGKYSFNMVQLSVNGATIEVPDFFRTEHRGFIVLESLKEKSKMENRNRGADSGSIQAPPDASTSQSRQPPEEPRVSAAEQERSDHQKENLLRRFVVDRREPQEHGPEVQHQSELSTEEKAVVPQRGSKKDEKRKR